MCVFCSICSRMGKFSQKNETWMSQGDSQANRLQERVDLLPTFTGPKLGRTSAGSFFVVRHCSRRLHGWMVFENSHGIQVKKMVQIKRTTAVHVGKKHKIYLYIFDCQFSCKENINNIMEHAGSLCSNCWDVSPENKEWTRGYRVEAR